MTALDSLLEGFAAEPPVLDGRLRIGDRVRVPVKGQDSVVGRVVRPSDSKPATHLLVAPEGGGPHVEAAVKSATHDTPERHGRERVKRQAEMEARGPVVPGKGQPAVEKPGAGAAKLAPPQGPVREASIGLMLEEFKPGLHPRGWHGRWIGKPDGKVLRVFHGDTHVGDVTPGESRTHTMIGVGRVVGEAGRTISTGDIATVVDKAKGSPEPTPRVIPKGGNANELRGGIPMLPASGKPAGLAVAPDIQPSSDRHGGFKVGDQIRYRTPAVVNGKVEGYSPYQGGSKVVRLARNGYLTVQDPKFGTTHDVHPQNVKHDTLHPGFRGEQAQRAIKQDRARIAREKAERAAAMPKAKDAWAAEPGREAHFAAELSGYIGKGKIVSREPGTGHLNVLLSDGRRGRVRPDQAFRTQKEAREFARVPQEKAGWSAAAQLSGALGRKAGERVLPPFSSEVRTRRPQGEGPPTPAQHRKLDSLMTDIQAHTPDFTTAQNVVRHHLARANVRRSQDLSNREFSLLLKELGGLAKHGPGALESERVGIGLLVEAFKAPAPPAVAASGVPSPNETVAQSMARGAASVRTAKAELAANAAWNASKHPRGAAGKFSYSTGGKRAHVGSSKHTSHTALSTKGYGNYVGVGARGALVKSVQRQLGIKTDGVYGQQTKAAIERFQRAHGLTVDGTIGRQTIAALRGKSGAAKIAPGPLSVKTARVVKHKPRVRAPVMSGGGVRVG